MKTIIILSVLLFIPGLYAQNQTPQFTISTVAGNGTSGYSGDGGPAVDAGLNPNGVAVDASGNVYIVDVGNERIRKVAPNGTITTFAGTGATGFRGDGGPATEASLNQPSRVAVDTSGNVYIADSENFRVRKVAPDGTITTVAGNGGAGNSGDGGPATSAALDFIGDIALDTGGDLLIATNGNVIRKVTPNGVITTVAGNGKQGFSGDGGPATSAAMNTPRGIAVDAAGNLFIADQSNERIRKVSNGVITTVAGSGAVGYAGDGGPATIARLSGPAGLALDAAGNLYISDRDNNRIRILLVNGTISTVAGDGNGSYSGDGGPAKSAGINGPRSVAILAGQVWVADSINERIRLLTPGLQPPSITANGIVPVYSSSPVIQPGSWISIYGNNFAGATTVWNGNFPQSLGGVSVTINQKPAYLWFVGPTQMNLQAPDDTATGSVSVLVTTPAGNASSTVTLGQYAPSFSLYNSKYAAAIVPTVGTPGNSGNGYDYIGPGGSGLPFTSRPVSAGETVLLYGVGFGPTTPAVPAGAPFSGAAPVPVLPAVTIGGVSAKVTFAGIVEAGLYQLNVVVPSAGSGDKALLATIGGVTTPANVFITLQ